MRSLINRIIPFRRPNIRAVRWCISAPFKLRERAQTYRQGHGAKLAAGCSGVVYLSFVRRDAACLCQIDKQDMLMDQSLDQIMGGVPPLIFVLFLAREWANRISLTLRSVGNEIESDRIGYLV
jgi:hypothetical protein